MRRKSKEDAPQLHTHLIITNRVDLAKYLAEVTSGIEDYFTAEAFEIKPTRWIGGGSRALGLEGRVSEGELEGVLIGRPIGQLGGEGEAAR